MVTKGKQTLLTEADLSEARRQASAMEILVETEGWKILEDWANKQIEQAKEVLASPIRTKEIVEGDTKVVITKEEAISEIQGGIDGVRAILQAVNDTIKAPQRIADGIRRGTILVDNPQDSQGGEK